MANATGAACPVHRDQPELQVNPVSPVSQARLVSQDPPVNHRKLLAKSLLLHRASHARLDHRDRPVHQARLETPAIKAPLAAQVPMPRPDHPDPPDHQDRLAQPAPMDHPETPARPLKANRSCPASPETPAMLVPPALPDPPEMLARTAMLVNPDPRDRKVLPDHPAPMVNRVRQAPPAHLVPRERRVSVRSTALSMAASSSRTEQGDKPARPIPRSIHTAAGQFLSIFSFYIYSNLLRTLSPPRPMIL